MENIKCKIMEQVEKLLDSENLENEGKKTLEDSVEKFNEGLKVYGEWLGKTYGNKKTE